MSSNSRDQPEQDRSEAPTQEHSHSADVAIDNQPAAHAPSNVDNRDASGSKKRRQRSNRKRRNRRQSFADPSAYHRAEPQTLGESSDVQDVRDYGSQNTQFYKLGNKSKQSSSSLDSEALLDHREQENVRTRKSSVHQRSSRPSGLRVRANVQPRPTQGPKSAGASYGSGKGKTLNELDQNAIEDDSPTDDRTPLMAHSSAHASGQSGYGGLSKSADKSRYSSRHRRDSVSSSVSKRQQQFTRQLSNFSFPDYDINNPPSVPASPALDPVIDYEEVTIPEFDHPAHAVDSNNRSDPSTRGQETIIDVDPDPSEAFPSTAHAVSPNSPDYYGGSNSFRRRPTIPATAEEDVCLPFDRLTDLGEEEDYTSQTQQEEETPGEYDTFQQRRRRRRAWPDLSALEEWSAIEKEERTMEGVRAKKVNEPVLVGGRLRPSKMTWRHEDEEEPFRWTYFNDELDSSLRSHTISGLQQLGHSFRELFIPDCPVIEDSDSDSDEDGYGYGGPLDRSFTPVNDPSRVGTRQSSVLDQRAFERRVSSAEAPAASTSQQPPSQPTKPKRYGPRPVFWLDVLQPTYEEMRVISRAFGIHKLTAEDIMEQEAREKVELFRNYYFVNYRTFEQDDKNDNFMQAVNMYFVVFRGGILSFHFSQMPHPANVRRRIRQLTEHQYTDSDWISYAIIDNITDAYAPLIEQIETEVDEIDEQILRLNSPPAHQASDYEKSVPMESSESSEPSKPFLKRIKHSFYDKLQNEPEPPQFTSEAGRDMLLRVGECRKRVMGLYRLLGNKVDVIKGLAKRYNEQKQLSLRSDVGLYLGDIQDHIITMTGNLTHYESILARAHSNYLAQINIGMNERAEKTTDILNKLTVLGTIVLPMNVITGMWGMNVLVPGQDVPSLWWFWGITFGLVMFGVSCFFTAKRLYGLV